MKKVVIKLVAICDKINKVIGYLSAFFFCIMFISCVLQVFTREVLNDSLSWTDELARYTFIWANMLGASVCIWEYGHAALTVLIDKLPYRFNWICKCFSEAVVGVIAYILFRYGLQLLSLTKLQRTAALGIPMTIIYVSVQVVMGLAMVYSLVHLLELLFVKNRKSAKEEEN